jgi:hypothetical protein
MPRSSVKIRAEIMALKSVGVAKSQGEANSVGVTTPKRASNSTAENLGEAVGNAVNAALNLVTAILEAMANGIRTADEKLFGDMFKEYFEKYSDMDTQDIDSKLSRLEGELADAQKEEEEKAQEEGKSLEEKFARKFAAEADRVKEEEQKKAEKEAKEKEEREKAEKEAKEKEEREKAEKEAKEKEAKEKEREKAEKNRKKQEKIDESKNSPEAKAKHAERAKKPQNKYKDNPEKLEKALAEEANAAAVSFGEFFDLVDGREVGEGEEVKARDADLVDGREVGEGEEVKARDAWKKAEKEKAEEAEKIKESNDAAESVGYFFTEMVGPEWQKEVQSEIASANSGDEQAESGNLNQEEKKEESFLGKVAAALGEVFSEIAKKLTTKKEKDPVAQAAAEAIGGDPAASATAVPSQREHEKNPSRGM